MLRNPESKYRPFRFRDLPDRTWPSRVITRAPRWLSTDLRDGNQALIDPMNREKKLRFFDTLVRAGFKEIEVGFPSASQTEFDFIRHLIESDHVPGDVRIQVLTQAREELIRRSFASLAGARQATMHLYNATSPLFRRVVFNQDTAGTKAIAVAGTRLIRELADAHPETDWMYEYSPETFSATEPEFALEICEAVMEAWRPTPQCPIIFNLPATVEVATPNIYADQIEWFCRTISRRDSVIVSVHPHNDRGTGIAAAELAVMAGADRIEGCLFGNGERTGNVDLVTLALNLYTQGVAPELDLSNLREIRETVEYCNQIPVHPRHPYAGDLVFTAFSGSHQDAIKKGFAAHATRNDGYWEMPYLPIDPADVGESYEAVIRVNSQSGKGGIAWVLEQDHGLKLPRNLQIAFSRIIQELADRTGRELSSDDIWLAFRKAYHLDGEQHLALLDYTSAARAGSGGRTFSGHITIEGHKTAIAGRGRGLITSALAAVEASCGIALEVADFQEHAIGHGSEVEGVAYVECRTKEERTVFGVGIDQDVGAASVKAVLSAANSVLG